MKKMTKADLIAKLSAIADNQASQGMAADEEQDHKEAEDVLLEYINDPAVKEAWDRIKKWYA